MDVDELFNIKGNVAIITGASSGLGQLFAETLASKGANIAICARRLDRLEAFAKQLEAKYGISVFYMALDVNDETKVKEFVAKAYEKFQRIDILVNNAGTGAESPSTEVPKEDWQRVINTNLVSVFVFAREVAKYMIKQGHGKIINIASIYGQVADIFPVSSYHAAKGGVINLTRALAVEWAQSGVNVNAIAPGYFPSEMTEDFFKDEKTLTYLKSKAPLNRIGNLDDLKGTLMLLSSHASDFITGQTIFVDGGWTIW
ncbi:MAG: SDR family oxidoreductase [Candidatus Micrarchaeota archaeon]|nr:SDR family oxidoreductase [Candidatus Micrarchaeota archaeon]